MTSDHMSREGVKSGRIEAAEEEEIEKRDIEILGSRELPG